MKPRLATRRGRVPPAAIACAFALAGCAPEYDWREVRPSEGGYVVMLPARPASMSRPVNLDGLAVTMTMSGARVGEYSFTVGAALLPDAEPATLEKAVAAMRAAMVRNIAGHETAAREVRVPVLDATGRTAATQAGARIEAAGRVADRPAHMQAQFTARGRRAWQAVVIGPAADPEQAQQFLDSFRILE